MTTPGRAPATPTRSTPASRRWLSWGVAALVVAGVFFVVLPRLADMREVWRILSGLGAAALAATVVATMWNQVTYWLVAMAALPGLSWQRAATVNLATTAIANTVPGGGGFGVAATARILGSWDFGAADIGRYVLITGIWNNFVKLGMPIVALALLAVDGEAAGWLVTTAGIGLVILGLAVAALVGLLRSDHTARWLGQWFQRAADRFGRLLRRDTPDDLADRTVGFREDANELLRRRWLPLTAATMVGHLSLFVVLLVSLRAVGIGADELSVIQALAGFAFARLLAAIPITPGGAGIIELGYLGVYDRFGADRSAVVAAVLMFRMLTYVLPIPLGALAWWSYRREQRA